MKMAKSNLSYDGTTPITPHEYKDVWQKAFDHFNDELFGGQLPDAMIVFARNAHSLGHYAPKRYLSRSGEFTKDEISLNQDGFKDRPDETIAGTFVQQMVSHWQQYHGHDKPKKGYHNKEWAAKMKSIGLYPSSTGKPGGSEIGQHVEHYIIPDGAYSYSYERLAETGWTPTLESAPRAGSKKKGDSKTPFRCRHCGQNAFGKPSLAILCMDCTTEALPNVAVDWRKLQMVTDEALEAQSYDAAEPEPEAPVPWDDTPDAETNGRWPRAKLMQYVGDIVAAEHSGALVLDEADRHQLSNVRSRCTLAIASHEDPVHITQAQADWLDHTVAQIPDRKVAKMIKTVKSRYQKSVKRTEGEQTAAPAKRKPGRPKGSKNKTRAASYDGKAAAPSPEPEQPDRLNEQSTALKAIADRMARKPKRRGRPPGSKNKPKTVAA